MRKIDIVNESAARRELVEWINNTSGCDISCLTQLYSIINMNPVRVRADDGTLGCSAWEGGQCVEVFADEPEPMPPMLPWWSCSAIILDGEDEIDLDLDVRADDAEAAEYSARAQWSDHGYNPETVRVRLVEWRDEK